MKQGTGAPSIAPKKKTDLRKDIVLSTGFHVGIELELCAQGESHDDEACYQARYDSQRDYLSSESNESILREYLGLTRDNASLVAHYFDSEAWINDYMSDFQDDGCQDPDCGFGRHGGSGRVELERELRHLTGNNSFKVVGDGSIDCDDDQFDAEVCWNYYASKDTIRDNEKILSFLENEGCRFNTSCGLHINLNNYLNVPRPGDVPTGMLDFLFNVVAPSRRNNTFCSANAVSSASKYSMIYHQGDRLEFRFFSPTLSAEKLNHYVTLANVVYRRLAGKNTKLPKKTEKYLLTKMTEKNGISQEVAVETIAAINSIQSVAKLYGAVAQEEVA